MNKTSLACSFAILSLLGAPAWAMECPSPNTINDPATAAKVREALPRDIDLQAPDALQSAVFQLKDAGVSDDLILDNLIAVYCVAVNVEPGVSDADKTQRAETFSQNATNFIFGDVD